MAKNLLITEKPSVAMEFAKVLKCDGNRKSGYIEAENWIITWCVGHLVTMSYPEKYDENLKFWRLDTLPFMPKEYKYEVIEAVEALNGKWQEDVKEVVLLLGAYMIKLPGKGENIEENKNKMLNQISNGEALNKFKELVERQGGDVSYIENIEKFKKAKYKMAVISTKSGIVNKLNAESVGKIAMMLGAGRTCKEDDIVKEVGIELNKKVGDKVEIGDVLAYIHGNSEELTEKAVIDLRNVYEIEKNN